MRDLFVGSIFIPFVPSQSIEAYNRPRGQSERRDTPHLPMLASVLRAFIVRLFKGADFSHPFLFDVSFFLLLLEHSRRKNTQRSEKGREIEKERERKTNKKFPQFRVRGLATRLGTLIPQFFVPYAILQFYGLFCTSR